MEARVSGRYGGSRQAEWLHTMTHQPGVIHPRSAADPAYDRLGNRSASPSIKQSNQPTSNRYKAEHCLVLGGLALEAWPLDLALSKVLPHPARCWPKRHRSGEYNCNRLMSHSLPIDESLLMNPSPKGYGTKSAPSPAALGETTAVAAALAGTFATTLLNATKVFRFFLFV